MLASSLSDSLVGDYCQDWSRIWYKARWRRLLDTTGRYWQGGGAEISAGPSRLSISPTLYLCTVTFINVNLGLYLSIHFWDILSKTGKCTILKFTQWVQMLQHIHFSQISNLKYWNFRKDLCLNWVTRQQPFHCK